MSHNVEKMMFTGRKSPWWYGNTMQGTAVGTNLGDDAVTSEMAMKAADLDWLVNKRQGGWVAGTWSEDGKTFTPSEEWAVAKGQAFLVRDKDNSMLGRCTDEYQEFQNAEAFEFMDGIVKDGNLLYHTAGSLEEGRRVWILAQTPTSWTIKRKSGAEDKHHAFLNCMLGHSGHDGISLMPTDVRVVCANTAGFADMRAEKENLVFRIPHRGDIKGKLALAAKAIEVLAEQSIERREVLQGMAQAAMNTEEFIDFATSIFLWLDGNEGEVEEAVKKFYEKASPLSKTKMENKVAAVTSKFISGIGNEGNTMYDAVQGFSEYFDHFDIGSIQDKVKAGKKAAAAVRSSWLGAGAKRKALVYKRLHERLGK
jgi:phage/plasmid-like protein (TIGR03299 family)